MPGKPLKMNEFLKQEFFLCPHMPYDDLNPVRTNMGQFLKIALLQPTPIGVGCTGQKNEIRPYRVLCVSFNVGLTFQKVFLILVEL